MDWKKLSMIYIFYYIHNNLNNYHIIVSHHEAERVVTIGTTSDTVIIEIKDARIRSVSSMTTAAQANKIRL